MVRRRCAVLFCLAIVLCCFALDAAASELPIRFSLPPVLEALPVAFAEDWGLFEKHGVAVELIGITDNTQRSAALMTGNLDGLMSDVTHAVLDASVGVSLIVTAAARSVPQTGSVALALLSPTSFRITSLEQLLASKQLIGVLYRSDYEFMLDRLVTGASNGSVSTARYSTFGDMLQLATMFGAQWLGSAVLPEPYVSYIATYYPPGGSPLRMELLSGFDGRPLPPTVVVFRRSYVEAHPDAVAAFHAAVAEAIERLNAMPRDELVNTGLDVAVSLFFQAANIELIGQEVLDALPIPTYLPLGTLGRETFDEITGWMKKKGYVVAVPDYDGFVDAQFLP